jgi:hypothetical protein
VSGVEFQIGGSRLIIGDLLYPRAGPKRLRRFFDFLAENFSG